jgi:DNA-binding transcriptional ArsR family regulator
MDDLGKIVMLKLSQKKVPMIIQLNNLDLNDSFTPEQMKSFFNSIRDSLQNVNYSWIINGKTGLVRFLNENVRQFSQIARDFKIPPLSLPEVKNALKKRIEKAGYSGRIPIEDKLLEILYNYCEGSFREMLKMIQDLLWGFKDVHFKSEINLKDAKILYSQKLSLEINRLYENDNIKKVIEALSRFPNLIQADLLQKIEGMNQPTISRILKKLEDEGVVKKVYDEISDSNSLILTPKYQLTLG